MQRVRSRHSSLLKHHIEQGNIVERYLNTGGPGTLATVQKMEKLTGKEAYSSRLHFHRSLISLSPFSRASAWSVPQENTATNPSTQASPRSSAVLRSSGCEHLSRERCAAIHHPTCKHVPSGVYRYSPTTRLITTNNKILPFLAAAGRPVAARFFSLSPRRSARV